MISPWQANQRAQTEREARDRRARVRTGKPVRDLTEAEARDALYGPHTRSGRVDRVRGPVTMWATFPPTTLREGDEMVFRPSFSIN
jgi:hypothetical protein